MSELPGGEHGHEEEIHMPPNSWWPLIVSIGFTVTMVGLLAIDSAPFIFFVGLVVLLVGIGGWVKDARSEYRELH
ncbi:MAG: aa3-type cytochrome oxidase subunit IV [Candidatus Dormibacteria bacterium]